MTTRAKERGDAEQPRSDHALAAANLPTEGWDPVGARPAAWTFLVFFLAWMMVVFTVWTTWPGQDHGTRMADSNIMNAARNYDAHGLAHRHGVPQLETYADDERPPTLYGTYPPGPYWMHALLRNAGLRDLSELRGASVVGSALAGLLGLAAFSVLARSWLVGACAAFFYCFSAPFSGYADSVHMNVWMQIGLFGFLLAWVGFERMRGGWRWGLLALAGLAYFFEIWMTLEHIALIAIVVAVRTILSRRPSIWIGGAALAAVCLTGLASRVWHLKFEFGTIEAAMDYLLGKYAHRSGEGGGGGSAGVGFGQVVAPWLDQLYWSSAGEGSRRREFGYPLLWAPLLGVAAGLVATFLLARIPALRAALERRSRTLAELGRSLGAHRARDARAHQGVGVRDVLADSRIAGLRATRAGLGWGALLLGASLHWHLGMRQHAMIHPHVILNMLPGMALILGSLAAGGFRLLMPDCRPLGWVRWLGAPLAVALMILFGTHLKYAAALNRLFPLSPMHAALGSRAAADQWWRDLGAGLRGRFGAIRRVVLYHWGPRQANLMGLPHQYVEGGVMPLSFEGDPDGGVDLLMIEFPRRQKTPRAILEDGLDRFGFPELAQGPESTTLFFRAGAPEPVACDVRFVGGVRMEQIRLSQTLTGDGYALCFLLRGPNAGAFAPAEPDADPATAAPIARGPGGVPRPTMAASVRTFDAAGQRTGVFTPRLALRATYRNRALVWVVIDKHRLPEGGSVRISLTPRPQGDRVEIERGRVLPVGMLVDLESDEIIWTPEIP